MLNVTRGSTVQIPVTFPDFSGNPLTVPSANLTIEYHRSGIGKSYVTIAMSAGVGASWVATWDTSIANSGTIYWHAKCGGGIPIAVDGCFNLTANDANQDAPPN